MQARAGDRPVPFPGGPASGPHAACRRCGAELRRPCQPGGTGGRQRLDPQGRGRAGCPGRAAAAGPPVPAGLAVRGVLQGLLRARPRARAAGAAARLLAGLGLRDRPARLRGHQQPRHRRRRRGHGHLQQRPRASGQDHRPRHQDRPCPAQGRECRASRLCRLGGQRRGPDRRLDGGDRQSVRARLDRDRRHRLGPRPRHPGRTL